jgi:tetratricopeptide (TPR) repeat protein
MTLVNLCHAYSLKGNKEKVDFYSGLVKLDELIPLHHHTFLKALVDVGLIDRAMKASKYLINKYPKNRPGYLSLGNCLFERGQCEDGLKYLAELQNLIENNIPEDSIPIAVIGYEPIEMPDTYFERMDFYCKYVTKNYSEGLSIGDKIFKSGYSGSDFIGQFARLVSVYRDLRYDICSLEEVSDIIITEQGLYYSIGSKNFEQLFDTDTIKMDSYFKDAFWSYNSFTKKE